MIGRRLLTREEEDLRWDEQCWRRAYLHDNPRCGAGAIIAAHPEIARWPHRCRTWAVELHERQKRSRLGSTTDPANCLPVCRPCHDFTEARVEAATMLGLLVHTWEEPALVPVGLR